MQGRSAPNLTGFPGFLVSRLNLQMLDYFGSPARTSAAGNKGFPNSRDGAKKCRQPVA